MEHGPLPKVFTEAEDPLVKAFSVFSHYEQMLITVVKSDGSQGRQGSAEENLKLRGPLESCSSVEESRGSPRKYMPVLSD